MTCVAAARAFRTFYYKHTRISVHGKSHIGSDRYRDSSIFKCGSLPFDMCRDSRFMMC